jgi:hypothetical protein
MDTTNQGINDIPTIIEPSIDVVMKEKIEDNPTIITL